MPMRLSRSFSRRRAGRVVRDACVPGPCEDALLEALQDAPDVEAQAAAFKELRASLRKGSPLSRAAGPFISPDGSS